MTRNLIAGTALAAGLALVYWLAWRGGIIDAMSETDAFRGWIAGQGWWGPMAVAVVFGGNFNGAANTFNSIENLIATAAGATTFTFADGAPMVDDVNDLIESALGR